MGFITNTLPAKQLHLHMNAIDQLNQVLEYLKKTFVGKDEIIDLLGICLVARENAFLLGPPGTAKSAIVRTLSQCIVDGNNFEYLLTRFTEPSEIFGPFDIRKLKEGELITNTEGMMPEASLVFLDEIFNANSAILNSLLMALNERIFRRGRETRLLPALMFVGASNQLPQEETLNALLDRFLIRINCNYVAPDQLEQVLIQGWKQQKNPIQDIPSITPNAIKDLQAMSKNIDLSPIRAQYVDLIHSLRNTGFSVSDRRAVKIQNLIAASALLADRQEVITSDLWVMRHIWDTEEQIETLQAMIEGVIGNEPIPNSHPQAFQNALPDAEVLMQEIISLTERWEQSAENWEEKNLIKDQLRFLQNRNNWLQSEEKRRYIQQNIDALWQKILAQS
ncbi:AAA family ATPase [Flectobacillus roseus]|uniref:AAA family ATPase n=1 Tax=Flectobacillus roseus TaxID=502259 RepID=A0ABT6Y8A8_9BACT|nr:AAA family ATPase [Flectobacillus roseus]MDI9859348.1 AAA family ATPase [Flectobacillus roseus]